MKRTALPALALLAALSTPTAHAFDPASLWLTPDQRGDRLLSHGDAAGAAKTYRDPRRRAYAEAQAGDFAAAARDLAPLDDADAHYNRGNALARSGDLKGALAAYDQALAHDPKNTDAQYNRDLVAKALDQPKRQDPKAGDNQGGDQKDRGDRTDQKNQDPSQQGGDTGQKGDAAQNAQGQKPKNQDQSGQQQAQDDAKSSPQGSDANGQPQPRDAQGQDDAQRNSASASPPKSEAEEAEQAKRDAQAALASQQQDAQQQDATPAGQPESATPGDADRDGAMRGSAALPQRTEAQLAQEQWLRRIPDDPGGLLRRKFEIEHQRRQQQRGGAGEDTP